ncbi:MAG: class I adenylate-forming enzyme family protein [Myxococcota bacterium]
MRRLSVRAAAEEVPARAAIVAADGRTLTHAELWARVRGAMAGLRAAGVHPGDAEARVALPAHGDLETLVVVLALVELAVPLVPLHPKLTASERGALLDALAPSHVLDRRAVRGAAAHGADSSSPEGPPRPADPEQPLAVVATSGTSGRPKGTVLSRRAFVAAADASARNLGWREDDRWLLCMPMAHVGGLSIPLRALAARRTTVLAPGGAFDPTVLIDVVERRRVTLLSLVPTMLARWLEALGAREAPAHLRAVLLGGAGVPADLLARARDRKLPVLTTYGLTETCGQVTTQRPGTLPDPGAGSGMPLPGLDVRVREGEIQVRGSSLASGYLRGSRLEPLPCTSDGFLRTGDAGRLDEAGRLHVLGRLDDRIVTGGENVDPLDVEGALRRLPGVRDACVFGVDDATWGQVVAAAIVPGEGGLSLEALRRAVRTELAPHRRPRRVAVLDRFVTTGSGKVDRRATAAKAIPCLRPLFD